MCADGIADGIYNDNDESLFILLDDETETNHIFGEQSISALLTTSSDHFKLPRRTSRHVVKSSKESAWHGSCASFRGSNSELLHLSSSFNESNESCMFLELHNHDQKLRKASPASPHAANKGKPTSDREKNDKLSPEKHWPSADCRQQKAPTRNSTLCSMSQNESRFNCSMLLSDCLDTLPRKPRRETCNNDNDDNDVNFTDITTVNRYDSICSTLEETMSIIDKLFEASASVMFEDTLIDHSTPIHNVQRKATQQQSYDRSTDITTVGNSTGNTIVPSKALSASKEDEAPKRPTRGFSPTR